MANKPRHHKQTDPFMLPSIGVLGLPFPSYSLIKTGARNASSATRPSASAQGDE